MYLRPCLWRQNVLKTLSLTATWTWVIGRTWRNEATNLEASSLQASFHSAVRFYAYYWGRKVIIDLSSVNSINYNNYWSGKICLIGTNIMGVNNHFLCGFNAYFTRQNSCLVPLTWSKPPWLAMSRALGENPIRLFCQMDIEINCPLSSIFKSVDQCISQTSSDKASFCNG